MKRLQKSLKWGLVLAFIVAFAGACFCPYKEIQVLNLALMLFIVIAIKVA